VVSSRLFRGSVAVVAALSVLTLAALPVQHLHAAGTEEGHHAEVIHRHWDGHHPAGPEAPAAHEDDQATRWMDSPFTHPEVVSHIDPDVQGVLFDLFISRSKDASRLVLPFVRFSVHDPPDTTSHGLRGPPFLVA
jgi:hypothetical protein